MSSIASESLISSHTFIVEYLRSDISRLIGAFDCNVEAIDNEFITLSIHKEKIEVMIVQFRGEKGQIDYVNFAFTEPVNLNSKEFRHLTRAILNACGKPDEKSFLDVYQIVQSGMLNVIWDSKFGLKSDAAVRACVEFDPSKFCNLPSSSWSFEI